MPQKNEVGRMWNDHIKGGDLSTVTEQYKLEQDFKQLKEKLEKIEKLVLDVDLSTFFGKLGVILEGKK